jgi:hypothetical protein
MGLASASRALFPKLRVHAEGIATRPTEQTWWVDEGPHAAWTTSRELLIDQDAMLLQGKHVLHVASRVIGDMASEDSTPAELPFVIDTLAPNVDVRRDGDLLTIRARDLVSAEGALVARRRVAAGAWTDWLPLASVASFEAEPRASVDVEVRDEEGNVGRLSLPLRGKGDSSLAAAGSGCGCRVMSGRVMDADATIALGVGLALAGVVARRRARGRRSSRGA